MKRNLILPLIAYSISLLALTLPLAAAQDATDGILPPALVTPAVLESKIAEIEATTGIDDDAKTNLVELYRKTLSNLRTTSSNAEAANAFQRASETAPVQVQTLREELDESNVMPPADTLEADLSTPLRQIEQLLQIEKADLVAVDARRADFEKRLDEEAGRPALIRQRLTEAKRDKAAASVEWVGKRVKILRELVNRKRQAEAEQATAQAEVTRREAEGKHPLVIRLAEKNAALSEEIAGMASRLGELAQRAGRADKLARQIQEDFKSAREIIDIGGLSQELGHMLLQQRQSLPDLRSLRRQAEEREDKASEIGVRRLRHRQEQKRLRDLEAYVAGIAIEAAAEETAVLRKQLRDLATERKALLEKDIESHDFYLRKLGELESAQQRLLDAIEDFDAFLDEHLLWVRSASQTQLVELRALPEQVWRIISPTGWLEVAHALTYQATHSPAFVLLALALGALLLSRRRLVLAIKAIGDKLGKPTTDRFGYSV